MYLNQAMILGNLTRDPELKALPSGVKVCSFAIATNESYKNKAGEKVEKVEFHNIVVFGSVAENCGAFLRKGQSALVEGKIQTRSWDKSDGTKAYRTEILANHVTFGAKSPKTAPGGAGRDETTIDAETGMKRTAIKPVRGAGNGNTPAVVPPGGARTSADQIDYPAEEINPDDIPF